MATSRGIRRAYDIRLADLELNLSEASLLSYVDEHGPLSQIRLAEALGMGRASAGTVVAVLERRDLVERQPNPDDGRVWLVAPTATGRAVVGRISDIDISLRAELRAGLTHEQRHHLAMTLLHVQRNIRLAIDGQ